MRTQTIEFVLNPKQRAFCESENVDEVCYGGAAGGGKTFVQCADALRYAIKYPGSKQLMIRRTFPELERNIIRQCLEIFPRKPFANYNATKHLWTFSNGSLIEFGYLARASDVYGFQGSEWDVIRVDEVTHLPYSNVDYLRSRLRGAKPYPRSMRYTTNPGNIGHMWVKKRFIDPVDPYKIFKGSDGTTRLYIPASVYDNKELMRNDPGYVARLEAIQDRVQREFLLHGNWNVVAGAFFEEFNLETHVVEPFDFSKYAGIKLYRSIDYGLDMMACYWYAEMPPSAINPEGSILVYRELHESNLTISQAAKKILEMTPANERIIATYAPVDVMQHRDRVAGRNQADMFNQSGLTGLVQSNSQRETGWLAVKELLQPRGDYSRPILKIFSTCRNLIKYIPMQVHDEKNFGDLLTEPHEITHSVDSLRYFAIQWHTNHIWRGEGEKEKRVYYPPDMLQDYRRSKPADRLEIERMMGGKPKFN